MDQKKRRPSGKAPAGVLIWFCLMIVLSMLRNLRGDPELVLPLMSGVIIVVVLAVILSAVAKRNRASAGEKRSNAADPWNAARTPVSKPAAPARTAPVYDTDGTDTDRDRQRRRAQLDAFLKNGIIDRKEYAALLARHENRR